MSIYFLITKLYLTQLETQTGFPLQFKLIESSNHPEAQAVGSAYLIMFSSNKTFVEKLNITVSWPHRRTMHYASISSIKDLKYLKMQRPSFCNDENHKKFGLFLCKVTCQG